jgi:hypothetical protein
MKRAATSFPDEWAALIEARAKSLGRSESNYIARLIEQDLQSCGMLGEHGNETAELITMIVAASEEDPKFRAKLLKLIPASLRGKTA